MKRKGFNMKKIIASILLVFTFAVFGNEVLYRVEMSDAFLKENVIKKKYTLQKVDGKNCLYLKSGNVVEFKLPGELSNFEGETLRVTYRYKLKNVPKPAQAHLGFKIMGSYKYDGKSHCGHNPSPYGTKDWTWEGYNFVIRKNAKDIKLSVILPAGEAWISDLTVSYPQK